MVEPLALLIVLGTVFAIIIGGRGHRFRPGLARTSARKSSGPNAASILAVVGIASLILEAGNLPVLNGIPGVAPLLVALAVVLIIGVVVGRSVTEVMLGLLGVALLVMTSGLEGTITLIILTGLMVWLLGAVRGWMG